MDIVTEVQPSQIDRVNNSEYAKLVFIDAVRVLAGVINRESDRFPLHDKRARQALNLAVDRKEIVEKVFLKFADSLAGLTPLAATGALPHSLSA